VITGFNTDVEHDGVVYHVQTEDKGLDSPLILSLVYTGGAILASKRSPYQDLIEQGFDEAVLADRLKRQHRLICAAIRAGRVEELKRMNAREPVGEKPTEREFIQTPPQEVQPQPEFLEVTLDASREVGSYSLSYVDSARTEQAPPAAQELQQVTEAELEEGLRVSLTEEQEFRSGETLNLGVLVTLKSARDEKPVGGVAVSVKVLGTTFRPVIVSLKTQKDGIAMVTAAIPKFSSGRAAILVRAVRGAESVEIRRVVLPAK
jgi:hypothetical protein